MDLAMEPVGMPELVILLFALKVLIAIL